MFFPIGFPIHGGDEEIRTLDPLLAGQVLSQLSYTPVASFQLFRVPLSDPENRTTIDLTRNHSYLVFFYSVLFVRWTVIVSLIEFVTRYLYL